MDYVYRFNDAAMTKIPVSFQGNSFIWPDIKTSGDTVLLKLDVTDKIYRKLCLPYLEVVADDHVNRQYLERNNKGIRYFNLTNIAHKLSSGQNLKLHSNRLKWDKLRAELLVFNSDIAQDAKVLVIAPHPDDAELAAFGLYGSFDSHIINITSGEAGRIDYCKTYSDDPVLQRAFKAKVRVIDGITAPIWGGVDPQKVMNLGYFSGTLIDMYRDPDKSFASNFTKETDINKLRKLNISTMLPSNLGDATWNNLVNDLQILIKKIAPDIIVLPHPVLDKNTDHQMSSFAVFEAVKNLGLKRGKFLFYVTHSVLSSRYPYGSRHSPVTVPPNFIENNMEYSIYSHKLTKEQQIEKLFALNTMHDIAPIPGEAYSIGKQIKDKLFAKSKYYKPWLQYFRKAVRANELFLVVPFDELLLH